MKQQYTIREATELWINRDFTEVPGAVFEELAKVDHLISHYNSDLFRLLNSPSIECAVCGSIYGGKMTLDALRQANELGASWACESYYDNDGHDWRTGHPEYAFPCGWGTLFSPKDSTDRWWFDSEKNREAVANLGLFVFESDIYGYLLGIDAGGFDFYDAFWTPLYHLRGLRWHE